MGALLLAAVLWQAPSELRIPSGESLNLRFPAIAAPAEIVLRARAERTRPGGSNHLLRVVLNGRRVGTMRDRRTTRLVGRASGFLDRSRSLPLYDFGRWRVRYGPAGSGADEIILELSDLLRPNQENLLTLDNANAGSLGPTPLVIESLRVERRDRPPLAPLPSPPDWARPRLRAPPPARFRFTGDRRSVRLSWSEVTAEVRTSVVGGPYEWRRELVPGRTHLEVRDTITNPSALVVGLRVRHAIESDATWIHLGGRTDPDVNDAYSPWNPTVFTPLGRRGLGLVAEDDVLRQQLRVDFDAASGTVGLRTDMLCLDPGRSITLVWSIYPTRRDDYWDFLNAVRHDWDVNRTVPGSYAWFTPDEILALPLEELANRLGRQQVSIVSQLGGWIDPRRVESPPLIGFGTFVGGHEFAELRSRLHAAIRKLRRARPQLVILAYFDAQRDSSPDAPRRHADSLLVKPDGSTERTDWVGRYSAAWGMVPTQSNRFGRAMARVARRMRRLDADGLYWDEMDGVDYREPRLTTSLWDGSSCLLDRSGKVVKKVGLVNLLSEDAKLTYARGNVVLGNTPATTRRFVDRGDVRMVEAHHEATWAAHAHLGTPLAYIGTERRDFRTVVDKIDDGLLVAGARLDYAYDVFARMFPFTPEHLQPGSLRGGERLITTRSGLHGWTRGEGRVRCFRYDSEGKEHVAGWHVSTQDGRLLVRVHLAPGEAAVIERLQ